MSQVLGLRYLHGGGGHFMQNVLGLHPKILPAYKPQVIKKFNDKHTHWQSLGTALMPIIQSMMFNAHFEYNSNEVWTDEKLWQEIMSQDKYIPTIQDGGEEEVNHLGTMHVRGVNFDWIQKHRDRVKINTCKKISGIPTIDFDMSSILDEQRFADSIKEVTTYFNLSDIDSEWLDIARRLWILNVSIVNQKVGTKNVLALIGQKEFKHNERINP
jgi:hypothetical protein